MTRPGDEVAGSCYNSLCSTVLIECSISGCIERFQGQSLIGGEDPLMFLTEDQRGSGFP